MRAASQAPAHPELRPPGTDIGPRALPWALLALAGLVALLLGWGPGLAAPSGPLPSASFTFSDVDDPGTQMAELEQYVRESGRPARLLAVDLEALTKVSQFRDIDASPRGFGRNACGLVAAAAAVGGPDWVPLVDRIAAAAGESYHRDRGIQPTPFVTALREVLGAERVTGHDRASLGQLYRWLEAGNVVIVDLLVNANRRVPSTGPPTYAHFARVLGVDGEAGEIYVQNTLAGPVYWTIPLADFVAAWHQPETSATLVANRAEAEPVTRWAVVIEQEVAP